jgi:hypothetical protein
MARATPVIREGSTVMVVRAGSIEPGRWKVLAPVPHSDGRDPAFDIVRLEDGRRRISRRSQLLLFDGAEVPAEGQWRR